MNDLQKVDCDLIQELRDKGMSYEAEMTLRAYFKNKKDNKKQLQKEVKAQYDKEYKHKKRLKELKR